MRIALFVALTNVVACGANVGSENARVGNIVGFQMGSSRAAAESVCKAAGFDFVDAHRGADGYNVSRWGCIGIPQPAPFTAGFAMVELWFENDRMTVIKLVSYEAQDFARLHEGLEARYGAPQSTTSDGVECTAAMSARSGCTEGARSGRSATWFEGPPWYVQSAIRLVSASSSNGSYVFLFFVTGNATKYWR